MKKLITVYSKQILLLVLVITAIIALWLGKEQVTNHPIKIKYYQVLLDNFLNISNSSLQQTPLEMEAEFLPKPFSTESPLEGEQLVWLQNTSRSSYRKIMHNFYIPYQGEAITAANWKGDCPYPFYIPPIMQNQSWFQPFLFHLQRLNLSRTGTRPRWKMESCTRWWSAKPELRCDDHFNESEPLRGQERLDKWKPYPKPPVNFTRPPCEGFGRKQLPPTSCATKHAELWKALDQLGVIYFPRAGTDLGVVRHSGYLSSDGDIDMFVDMPFNTLDSELRKILKPATYLSKGYGIRAFTTEVHWPVSGCPTVHMCFNDWMIDEMTQHVHSRYPRYRDTCECLLNSVPMSCHKETVYRTWLMYGPSWRVPIHAKALDVPHRARGYNAAEKLKKIASKDGLIREQTVRDLDPNVEYTASEMEMILAQLNDLHALITCQNDVKCRDKLIWY